MLQVKDLDAYYGETQILRGINLEVGEGELVAVIGANGAGKSTLLKCISGLLKPRRGTIHFQGKQINGFRSGKIVAQGLVQVPEGRLLFPKMTVWENLETGAYLLNSKAEVARLLETVYELFPKLKERENQLAGTLSGGEQQMVAIGRALMAAPKMIMFDEPSLGLAPIMVAAIFQMITRINHEFKVSALLIEQNVKHSCEICNRAYVIENGSVVLHGRGCDLLNNDHVRRAYLGL